MKSKRAASLPRRSGGRDACLRVQPGRHQPHRGRAGIAGGPRHGGDTTVVIVPVEQIVHVAHAMAALGAFHDDAHGGQIALAFVVLPCIEEQSCSDIDRANMLVVDRHRLFSEEPALTQHAHAIGVAGIAHGLLDHIRHLHAQQTAQPIGVECLERADTIDVDQLDFRQRRHRDIAAAATEACRTRVLGNDIDR